MLLLAVLNLLIYTKQKVQLRLMVIVDFWKLWQSKQNKWRWNKCSCPQWPICMASCTNQWVINILSGTVGVYPSCHSIKVKLQSIQHSKTHGHTLSHPYQLPIKKKHAFKLHQFPSKQTGDKSYTESGSCFALRSVLSSILYMHIYIYV